MKSFSTRAKTKNKFKEIIMAKIITLYFSRKGENYADNGLVNLEKGNTQVIAEFIHNALGGDIFEIVPAKPYSENYGECMKECKKEHDDGARPEVKAYPEDLAGYDVIFLGYPNWWGTAPMAVFTVLGKYDLSGVTIAPFCTNEGSGLGFSEREIASVAKGANVVKGISVIGHEAAISKDRVLDWAKQYV